MDRIPAKIDIEIALSSRFNTKLLAHSLRVEKLAVEMALASGESPEKASVAALLHDYGKTLAGKALISKAEKSGIKITQADKKAPYLLHAPVGAAAAAEDFGLTEDMALAIQAHTYGRPGMTKLDKIIYLADGLDPEREDPILHRIRDIAFKDIDRAFKELLSYTLKKLIDENKVVHPVSIQVWNEIAE